ncbi:rhodanese-like domain-containing protein [Cetobacterium sp. 8H]|uniref:rhodanese-like domain-containing protein n=1 Tax=Cetobacterium sp. 8H TaxID=2759681 RepID=UPI00163BAF17|nr:rhodanese-like domain-containing protein [Cetobacterium sp. 8H]MBC2850091.1 rhodanese-like domain-containing protein [Cetobacterium sp. 8H]
MKKKNLSLCFLFFLSIFIGTGNTVFAQNINDKVQKTLYLSLNDIEGDYETIPLSEVKQILDENKAILIDVRNPDEIQKTGMIKGAKNIPLPELEGRLNELDKNQPYITFCAVGGRSKKAAAILSKNGFKKIYNAQEGMNTWPYPKMIEKK